ncbi:pimeloyl-ACP methyl ester carboxylesterase [Rhodopseudomonas julia]|uniref:Pimeloyl-ACP methyl ester carboxylesterase n=1 Tax=Rhodopseudomonas julia TaxID=200617 RepID=A0ABU0C7G7_9BRAD|nr:alpha/beta hydrolase [Rhodopseudomonas julia]MDQ0326471.1 pimeloyl-ACP methyl ester carboxylesterase [Rhodopseudomonas julia]
MSEEATAGTGEGEGRVLYVKAQDGLTLALRLYGDWQSPGLPLVCLPGLSRNGRDFDRLARFFSAHADTPRLVAVLDYRGRGLSGYDPDWTRYTPMVEADDVLAVTTALGIERAIFIGTSRGGLITMIMGAMRPGLIAGVVLNDIGPKIEGTGLARIKNYLSNMRTPRSMAEAEKIVRQIAGHSFTALSDEDWHAYTCALFVERDGEIKADFDPKLLKTVGKFDLEEAVPTLWPQFDSLRHVPLLSVRGENSDLLSAATVEEMAWRHPGMEQVTVEGQGHAPLLRDQPTLDRIAAFARRCDAHQSPKP